MDLATLAWILGSGLATGLGGVGILALRQPSNRLLDVLLGFTAGVMLAAAVFSLIVPGLERGTLGEVLAGMAIGAAVLMYLDARIPHLHARFREHGRMAAEDVEAENRSALLLAALTIHNIPEGFAVGLAFAAGGMDLGVPIALAIGIQNVPEGFAAAAPLRLAKVSRGRAAGVAALTGVVEPPAAVLAFFAFELIDQLLVAGLGFAAGAMLYVVVDELIPEAHGHGNEREVTAALLGGFALMMLLDNAFG
ncbi:MAG TPA: ZIP family metal transporter [Thermoleophilaceae bacterium]|nr:ZIP family metal transporter [Thermoleophilaceae bacterium]